MYCKSTPNYPELDPWFLSNIPIPNRRRVNDVCGDKSIYLGRYTVVYELSFLSSVTTGQGDLSNVSNPLDIHKYLYSVKLASINGGRYTTQLVDHDGGLAKRNSKLQGTPRIYWGHNESPFLLKSAYAPWNITWLTIFSIHPLQFPHISGGRKRILYVGGPVALHLCGRSFQDIISIGFNNSMTSATSWIPTGVFNGQSSSCKMRIVT